MTSKRPNEGKPVLVSIGIFAWNEERAIAATLATLFEQSLFAEMEHRGAICEIHCVTNGCTDQTPEVAAELFQKQQVNHPHHSGFSARVDNLAARGKNNAWNEFVHSISSRDAKVLFMMDADILIRGRETLLNMLRALELDAQANVAVDIPRKDVEFKSRRRLRDNLSLTASQMTQAAPAQLCGQLYCIRTETARNIYLPKDLAACEDGFIKALVCTDFLAHEVWPGRLRIAEGAEHSFEAYTSPRALLKNQKRQIIGQTIVHILVDQELNKMPEPERQRMADTIRAREAADPGWLKQLIQHHLCRTRLPWRLYPGLLSLRLNKLKEIHRLRDLVCVPVALASWFVGLLASIMAYRALARGCTNYWPQAERRGISTTPPALLSAAPPTRL